MNNILLSIVLCGAVCAASSAAVSLNGVFETSLQSGREYSNPSADVAVSIDFTSPSGLRSSVAAFWDGGDVWKVRFSPTEIGKWRWKSNCSDVTNAGLHARTGTFDCALYRGKSTLLKHGPLKLSSDRRYLVHSDGTPFFWLADTAWNGVLKARPQDWEKYLSIRKEQGFTTVQFLSTPWRSFDKDEHGDTAFTGSSDVRINPDFFKRLDAKVAAINEHGMAEAPVILWAVSKEELGQRLSEADAIRLSNYIVARWGAYNVVWMLGGDGPYTGDRAERWRRIGRAVFGDKPARPVTMHPGGQSWVADEFRREAWYSFIGYQSGHGDSEGAIRWLVQGPPATDWDKSPVLPVINLEPNYETILAYGTKQPFDARAVRTALYRSLLISPTAGVTYGHHGIWFWTDKPQVPTAHPNTGVAVPWEQAVKSEGAESVKHLAKLFGSIKWWTLRPDPSLVANKPSDPRRFIGSARSDSGDLAVIYLPQGLEIELNVQYLRRTTVIRWFNPSTGEFAPVGRVTAAPVRLRTPSEADWVLLVGR